AIDLPAAATASATSEPLPPTETETPAPSATLSPSPTESATVTETASPTATVGAAIPALNGKKLLFYYDESGFYVLNTSNASRSISPLIFERLDPNDQTLNRFEGWLWAEFYATLHPERCMRIEITKSEVYLRPPLCESRTLSSRFYARESEYIFWTAQPESQQFRVLWQGEEVGRCQIGAGSCEVFIP
ncbi:MAG: hypothetical protein RBS68_05480, partial [Anaerolineales bacterium]|nr:hypothetical protein [Anaerolineales bacterium]